MNKNTPSLVLKRLALNVETVRMLGPRGLGHTAFAIPSRVTCPTTN